MDREASGTTDATASAADSYIGSFISVISKSEIRYEGVLYYLNTRDSTLGLRNVRSYGTEGRKRDGLQVPPSEKIYEYILFRGADIKDLEVKDGPRAQVEEPICNDPAIIQPNSNEISLKSITAGSRPLLESNLNSEPSMLNAIADMKLGLSGSSQLTNSSFSPHGLPTQWPDYSGGLGGISGLHQHISSSTSMLYPMHNEEPPTLGVKNLSTDGSLNHSYVHSSTIPPNYSTPVSSRQFPAPLFDSVFSNSPLMFHNPTLSNLDGLTPPPPLSARSIDNRVPEPSFVPADSAPHAISPIDPTFDPLLRQNPPMPRLNQLSQPKLSEQSLFQDDVGVISSISPKLSPSSTYSFAPVKSPPLPRPSEKLPPSEYTEEFDFQAMNEKFKKDEIWGLFGKANYDKGPGCLNSGDTNGPGSAYKTETNPAYNKDEFFDTISRNNTGWTNNRYSERMNFDSKRDQFGYDGYGDGHHGTYNWGRGYQNAHRGGQGGYYKQT